MIGRRASDVRKEKRRARHDEGKRNEVVAFEQSRTARSKGH